MKKSHFLGIILIFASFVLMLVAATIMQPAISTQSLSASAFYAQITPTPITGDASVIGSTDGILLMGFVIMLIIIVPVMFYKNKE